MLEFFVTVCRSALGEFHHDVADERGTSRQIDGLPCDLNFYFVSFSPFEYYLATFSPLQ